MEVKKRAYNRTYTWAEKRKRNNRIMELRKLGLSYEAIASIENIHPSRVGFIVRRENKRLLSKEE